MVRYLRMHKLATVSGGGNWILAWREWNEGNRTQVSSLEDWRSAIELITLLKLVWAGGYAPPRSVCKTDVLLLHQAHKFSIYDLSLSISKEST